MQIELIPMKDFIRVNNLYPVTNPVVFEKGYIPTSDGILSKEIFGISVNERRENFSYIKLNGHFLTPLVFKLLKRLDRKIEKVVAGSANFIIEAGQLVEDENGDTGLEWLYKNWEKIKFSKNLSMIRNERVDVLSKPKDLLFIEEMIVIPAFYRDINLQSALGKNQTPKLPIINDMYCKLIRMSSMIQNSTNFDFVVNTTRYKMQTILVEIYDHFKEKSSKKHGHLRKSLLGKSIDYSSRLVISAPRFTANKPEDMMVDFEHTGVPLSHCCSLLTPFIVSWVRRFLQRELEQSGATYPIKLKTGEIKRVQLDSPETYFTDEYIKKKIDKFIHSPAQRFEKIKLPVSDKEIKGDVYLRISGRFVEKGETETESPLMNRPATWCDIFYMAAVDVSSDKHAVITRYPLLDYFGIFINKISVLSTNDVVPMYIGDKIYPNYPKIDLSWSEDKVSTMFTDSLNISNVYLQGLGGDYDGDQVTVKILYSQEANKEAEEFMYKVTNVLDLCGNNMRTTTNEAVQTLYMATKFDK